MLYVVSFGGHTISKWWQLPRMRQIYLFQTPLGNSIPLQLTGLEREDRRILLPSTVSQPVTWPWLGHARPAAVVGKMRCPSHWVRICLGIGGGTKGVCRIVERIPLCFGVGFLAKRTLEGKKQEPEWIARLLATFLLFLAFSFLSCFSSPWQLGEKEEHGSFKWTWGKEDVDRRQVNWGSICIL